MTTLRWPAIEAQLRREADNPPTEHVPKAFFTLILRGGQTRFHATEQALLEAEDSLSDSLPRIHFKYSPEHRQYFAWAPPGRAGA